MANPFDEFDPLPTGPASPVNPFDRFKPRDSRSGLRRAADWMSGVADEARGGALFGLADEAGAAIDATMQTVLPRARYTDSGEPLWAKGDTWSQRYDDALARERAKRAKFSGENPVASIAGNILGAMGGGAGKLGEATARLTAGMWKPVQFAAAGAVPGAVYGFGEGEGVEDRLVRAGGGAAVGAGLGVGFGYAAEGLGRLARYLTSRRAGAAPILTPQGQLTTEGRQALQQAGIDPDTVTQGFARALEAEVQAATRAGRPVDPTQLARYMQGQSLPVPVPQTRGQVTGSPSAQMFENLAEKGTYGQNAERIMRNVRDAQQAALRGNIERIGETVGGGQPVRVDPAIPGQVAQTRLAGMRGQEQSAVNAAYTAARQTQAGVPGTAVASMRGEIAERIGEAHNIANIPKAMNVVNDLDRIGSGTNASVPINRLFFSRAQLNSVIKGGGEDAVAARVAKTVLDRHLDDIVMQGLLQGDDTAIAAWQRAIAANREFRGRFKGGDLIEKLTSVDYRSGARQLIVPPDQATNAVFNAQKLFGAGNTVRDLTRLREVLGPQSAEWQGLRQEAVMRLFQQGRGPVNPTTGERAVSGANFSRAFDDVMLRNPTVMRTFFTPEEIATLRQFRDVANRATGVVKGGDNFSNTTVAASNVIQNLFGRIFTSERAAARLLAVPLVRSITDYAAGASLIGRGAARVRPLPMGAQIWGAPGGGAAAQEFLREPGQ